MVKVKGGGAVYDELSEECCMTEGLRLSEGETL